MGKLFCMMGKSASGKDTIYKALTEDDTLGLHTVIPYTTRPIREGEAEGENYYFVDEKTYGRMADEGKIIEARAYHTVHGLWRYFTADDGQIDLETSDYLGIGTLESFEKLKKYYGETSVIPVYIEVENGERLTRALAREKEQISPKYAEMCRRFLADEADFSQENILKAGIWKKFENIDLDVCVDEIVEYIKALQQ